MGDSIGSLYMLYHNSTPERKRAIEEREIAEKKAREENQKRGEQEKRNFMKKYGNRMNEMVTVKGHCAYGALSLRMTLNEAIEKGFSINCIHFDDERDDR